jgi:hypothetical protein
MTQRLPFGKYRGWALEQVPLSYLAWLIEESDVREPLRSAIVEEVRTRLDLGTPPPQPPPLGTRPPAEMTSVIAEIIAAGYRALSLRRHPDKGGTTIDMQRLNAARDWLRMRGLA